MNRRDFTSSLLEAIASFSLIRSLVATDAFTQAIRPITNHWVAKLHEMSQDVKAGSITPGMWQENIQELFNQVPLSDLLSLIDFERLIQGFTYPDLGVHTKRVTFPSLKGVPSNLAFHSKIFGMKKDRAIIPHGHQNMVSCHYVLKGAFQLKHYNKIEEDNTHMIIEPTIDEIARVGSHSSISDERNNIHWLKATTETAFTFDVLVLDLNDKQWHVDNIDPYEAELTSGNLLRVKKLDVEEALKRYGHDTHH